MSRGRQERTTSPQCVVGWSKTKSPYRTKSSKNLLTNPLKYDTIRVQNGGEVERFYFHKDGWDTKVSLTWKRSPLENVGSTPTTASKFFQKVFKKVLTNQEVCGTINSRGEGKAVPQRERPTRVSKTYSRWSDRTVFLCAGYKCEPDHAGWKNVVDTQDTQATLFVHNGREFCPLPMNGVECRRIK